MDTINMKTVAFWLSVFAAMQANDRPALWADAAEGAPAPQPVAQIPDREGGRVVLQDQDYLRLTFWTGKRLRLKEVFNKKTGRNYLDPGAEGSVFTLAVAVGVQGPPPYTFQHFLASTDFLLNDVRNWGERKAVFSLLPRDPTIPLRANLEVSVTGKGTTHWRLEVENTGNKPVKLCMAFPVLGGLRVSEDLKDNWYIWPLLGTAPARASADLLDPLAGAADMQILSVFDLKGGGGLYIHPASEPARAKYFALRKVAEDQASGPPEGAKGAVPGLDTDVVTGKPKTYESVHHRIDTPFERDTAKQLYGRAFRSLSNALGMAINYQFDAELAPGEHYASPLVAVGVFDGSFHKALAAYRRWVDTWFKRPYPVPDDFRYAWWANHPHSDTRRHPQYIRWRMEQHRKRGNPIFYDLVMNALVLSNWDSTLDAICWKKGIAFEKDVSADAEKVRELHEDGMSVIGWSSGFLMGRLYRSKKGGQHPRLMPEEGLKILEEWALLYDGMYGFYTGGRHQDLRDDSTAPWVNICIAAPGFADFWSDNVRWVVEKTGLDAVFIDSVSAISTPLCTSPRHRHRDAASDYVKAFGDMVRLSKEKTRPKRPALFSEAPGCDWVWQWMDGGWGTEILGERASLNPLRVALCRFVFPELKFFSGYCLTSSHNNLPAVLFNGVGIGQLHDTVHYEFDPYIQNAYRVLRENGDAFMSVDPPPVPLLFADPEGLCVNRFATPHKTIYTVFNAHLSEKKTGTFNLPAGPGTHFVDLMRHEALHPESVKNGVILPMALEPQTTAVIGALPSLLHVERNDLKKDGSGSIEVSVREKPGKSRLRLVLARRQDTLTREMALRGSRRVIEPRLFFPGEGGRLALQLLQVTRGREFLADELILAAIPGKELPGLPRRTYDFLETFEGNHPQARPSAGPAGTTEKQAATEVPEPSEETAAVPLDEKLWQISGEGPERNRSARIEGGVLHLRLRTHEEKLCRLTLGLKHPFPNAPFLFSFDVMVPESDGIRPIVGFKRPGGYMYWSIRPDHIEHFWNGRYNPGYLGAPRYPSGKWYRFEIVHGETEARVTVYERATGRLVYDEIVPHDPPASPAALSHLGITVVKNRVPKDKVRWLHLYLDNIGWKMGKP